MAMTERVVTIPRDKRNDPAKCSNTSSESHHDLHRGQKMAKTQGTCIFPGCEREHKCVGLCAPHYQQKVKGKTLAPTRAFRSHACSFALCERETKAKGLCGAHYQQHRRGMNLQAQRIIGDNDRRFESYVSKTDGCWEWTGPLATTTGYGVFSSMGEDAYAHRVSYANAYGPIEPGLVIDHKCHNVKCVRPKHLRMVTTKQNNENHSGATAASKSGIRGVWHSSRSNKWLVQVKHNGHRHSGGSHAAIEDAEAAAIALRNSLHSCNDVDRAIA